MANQPSIPPGVWRVGGSKPRNLYIGEDYDIGRMDSPELAAHIVVACNHYSMCEQIDRSPVHEPDLGGPTQWAYDAACKALEKHRQRANEAWARVDELERRRDSVLNWCDDAQEPSPVGGAEGRDPDEIMRDEAVDEERTEIARLVRGLLTGAISHCSACGGLEGAHYRRECLDKGGL